MVVYGYDPLLSDAMIGGFGVEVLGDQDGMVDCVIVTVAHDEFKEMGLSDMGRFMDMGETPVLVDVRGMFDREEAERRGIYYRRL